VKASQRFVDFKQLNGCSVQYDTETDYVGKPSLVIEKLPEPTPGTRQVYGCIADNMRLPFPSDHFDCYISNLSMMIVPNYQLQIKECFRVLKRGSYAAFSVWGRPERCLQFTCMQEASRRMGKELPPLSTNFNI